MGTENNRKSNLLQLTSLCMATFVVCLGPIQLIAHPLSMITVEKDAPTQLTAPEVQHFLSSHENLLSELEIPNDTLITLGSAVHDGKKRRSGFMRFTNELLSAVRPGYEKQDLYVLVHEYAHAVFEKNLLHSSKPYQKIYPDLVAISEASAKEGRQRIGDRYNRTRKVYLLSSALHELFADIVSVTYFQDPRAAKKAELFESRSTEIYNWENLLQRDFDLEAADERDLQWEKNLPLAIFANDPYYILLPARWAFWSFMKSSITSPDPQLRTQIIPNTFRALEKILNEVLSWDEQKLGTAQFEIEQSKLLNQRLIEELQRSLQTPLKSQ